MAPLSTAARVLATAISPSLCVWIPIAVEVALRTSFTIREMSDGSEPPFVSHRTRTSAPASTAAASTFIAYFGLWWYPSKKCSASKKTLSAFFFR